MYDIIVVGAGPAGLTAAIYGVRAGKSVLLFEKGSYGGQIVNTPEIDNYPGLPGISGYDFAETLYRQASALGAEIRFEEVLEITDSDIGKKIRTAKAFYDGRTVILAVGARSRKLGLPREDALLGRGISYCAACDGMFFRNRIVAVNGGGNTALEDARYLSDLCKKVYLIHRRESFRGSAGLLETVRKRENIELVLNASVTGFLEETSGLTGIRLCDTQNGREWELSVQGLFVAIGQEPDTQAFSSFVHLDSSGCIVAGEDCCTAAEGIFTAGDCRTKTVRQLTTAVGDGAAAALAAVSWIANNSSIQ